MYWEILRGFVPAVQSTWSVSGLKASKACLPCYLLLSSEIPESHEADLDNGDTMDIFDSRALMGEDSETKALRTALEECWTFCNTLATLSSIHRERVFNSSGTPDAHEKAWKSCWKLCKRLYQSRDDTSESFNVRTNLDLCRDFCQALFDVRQKQDEVADSVLRVSFELNNQ
jgi:hypothetical protein